MEETYNQLMKRQQKEYNDFSEKHLFFAFDKRQFEEQKAKKGIVPDAEIINLGIPGAFILREHLPEYKAFVKRLADEKQNAIDADLAGDGFIYEMFFHELNNHEYSYTAKIDETLEACGLTLDEVKSSTPLKHGLLKAAGEILPDIKLTELD